MLSFAPVTRFLRSEDGSILPLFAVSLVVVMGISALTFDIGRMAATQAELQSFADEVALAAAGELDGRPDAITRAKATAASLIKGNASFGIEEDLLSGPEDYRLIFLTEAPVADNLTGLKTDDPAKAHFVKVEVTPQHVQQGFGAAFASLSQSAAIDNAVSAQATAGMETIACGITPLLFCLPNSNFKIDANVGAAVKLRSGPLSGALGAGDMAMLDVNAALSLGLGDRDGVCSGLSGDLLQSCLLAGNGNRLGCFAQNAAPTKASPGIGLIRAALNTVFDIYSGTMAALKSNAIFAPAPNVISGYVAKSGSCIADAALASINTVGLPLDDVYGSGNLARFGTGNWSLGRTLYVLKNYGLFDPHPQATTRFAYYQAELAASGSPSGLSALLSLRAETGRPKCFTGPVGDLARRVLTVAAVDCSGGNGLGISANVKVKEFVDVFMLRPIGLDGSLDLNVEIIGSASSRKQSVNSSVSIHDVVQLVR
jgi:hypothetical protein